MISERARRAGVIVAPLAFLTFLVAASQVVTVQQSPTPVAAPLPARTSAPPTTTTVVPAEPDLTQCGRTVGSVRIYFANLSGKEGPNSNGPELVDTTIPGLSQPVAVDHTIRVFWDKLCVDPVLTAVTAAGFDPENHDPSAILTDAQWADALDFIRHSGGWSYAKGARNLYQEAPNAWTDYMVRGPVPQVGYARYPHGASWLLTVPHIGQSYPEQFRLKCGGQWVGPFNRVPRTFR